MSFENPPAGTSGEQRFLNMGSDVGDIIDEDLDVADDDLRAMSSELSNIPGTLLLYLRLKRSAYITGVRSSGPEVPNRYEAIIHQLQ